MPSRKHNVIMDNISHRRPHEGVDMKYKTILDRIMHYVDRKANFGQTVSVSNAKRAINYAYGAGKQTVVENLPDLEWEKDSEKKYESRTPFFDYAIDFYNDVWDVKILGIFSIGDKSFETLHEAQQVANEDYKERLKKALGI